ncbi:multicopper oxidase domain-containing protein [Azospirillum canadense]|uniref:multicopper oxidase domain-containing protein n=1 Tax=Azospirillum canadense TaxID=403962 RepID=UPI0022275FE2|nr:multicopper oxidase domain-containing protein [Azospirillum canadense]MCW2238040.1 spore coat protein A [Azospirillum canadense]
MAVQLLDPTTQPKFVNSLAIPTVIDATRGGRYVIGAGQTTQDLGLYNDEGRALGAVTTVWGYGVMSIDGKSVPFTPSYPGPTILARSGVPIRVTWKNALPASGYPASIPVDTSLHMAMVDYAGGRVPLVTHLHGGHTQAAFDGFPESFYTQGGDSGTYIYDYSQPGATLWYHDHALGVTRLNVYMGLAGFNLVRDATIDGLMTGQGGAPGVLPDAQHEVGAAIQDRAFTADGQLYRPGNTADDPLPGAGGTVGEEFPGSHGYPFATPEFFGDVLLVNGKAWPKMDVDRTTYTLHLLNGSDSRFYVLKLSSACVKMTLVGTDGGLLPKAITIDNGDGTHTEEERIVLTPGDRADVVLDFSKLAPGYIVTLENDGPAWSPFQGLDIPDEESAHGTSVGEVMQFQVTGNAPAAAATVQNGTILNPNFRELAATVDLGKVTVRKLGLFEDEMPDGHIQPKLGVAEDTTDINGRPVKYGALMWDDATTEDPLRGSTEVWEIYNTTADAHPIHLHQVQFQVLGKYRIADEDLNGDGVVGNDYRASDAVRLRPEDTGNQDTVWVAPGEMLRIVQTFDLTGEYVWHCHILSHEDNEMMRPLYTINTVQGTDKAERLDGTADIDAITGGKGKDRVDAGKGDDRIIATIGDGDDAYDGGQGADTYDLTGITAPVAIDLQAGTAQGTQIGKDTLASIENVLGGSGDDTITGSTAPNFLSGGAGADGILSGTGNDTLWGGLGNDTLMGGAGADRFLYYREVGMTSVAFGADVIQDFNTAEDRIEVDTRIFSSFDSAGDANSVLSHLELRDGSTVIGFLDPNTAVQSSITLSGVLPGALTANNFTFV